MNTGGDFSTTFISCCSSSIGFGGVTLLDLFEVGKAAEQQKYKVKSSFISICIVKLTLLLFTFKYQVLNRGSTKQVEFQF